MSATNFRDLLRQPDPILTAGVHDGLSARMAGRAGFDAVWASGFGITASKAMPDAGLISMTEHLAVTREIVRATSVPVVADVDDGFGDFVNVTRTVREYEAAGVAAICLEDQVHPKRCSFYQDVRRKLVEPHEFVQKIRAGVGARRDPDFAIIARTEAMVNGEGHEAALARARAYADAGADLVLAHSRSSFPTESVAFAAGWDRDVPLVVVPTTFSGTSAAELAELGFKVVILANQGLRAAIDAMSTAFTAMVKAGSASVVEREIAPLETVFDLVGVQEVKAIEQRMRVAVESAELCS